MELTTTQRQAVTKKKAFTYRGAGRAGKSRILDEQVEVTGWHRDYARAALRDALTLKIVKPRMGAHADVCDAGERGVGDVLGRAAGVGGEAARADAAS